MTGPADGACHVWWASVAPERPFLAELLSDDERARASRLRAATAREAFTVARALARVVVGRALGCAPSAVRFETVCRHCGGPHGKPRVAGGDLEVSWAHSDSRVVLALARRTPIGVDVETISARTPGAELVDLALAARERRTLAALPAAERQRGFLRYWTRKEAVLKATAHGLAVAPAAIEVSGPHEPPAVLAVTAKGVVDGPVYVRDLDVGPEHLAAVAMLGRDLAVHAEPGDELLNRR
jgi:4'-phosphopantetheinyl transferase